MQAADLVESESVDDAEQLLVQNEIESSNGNKSDSSEDKFSSTGDKGKSCGQFYSSDYISNRTNMVSKISTIMYDLSVRIFNRRSVACNNRMIEI